MRKFILSTDSCVDHFKTYLDNNDVYCIVLRRLLNGVENSELYDSFEEFEKFYADLKKGALPTTSQLGEFELSEYFKKIIDTEPEGDLVHLTLSSGLSGTYDNAVRAAEGLNKELVGRKVFVLDSLSASLGMGMLVDRLIELRNAGTDAAEAVKTVADIRDHQQVWVVVGNLFHLKRGGRLSGFKAAIGTLLAVKPIMIINSEGKLVIESTVKGKKKAVAYLAAKMKEYKASANPVYLLHSSGNSEMYDELEKEITKTHPGTVVKKGMVGPIIGTHLGEGSVAFVFEGAKRLKI